MNEKVNGLIRMGSIRVERASLSLLQTMSKSLYCGYEAYVFSLFEAVWAYRKGLSVARRYRKSMKEKDAIFFNY